MGNPIPAGVRALVLGRDDYQCQRCGLRIGHEGQIFRSYSLQHRLARGMGGSRLANRPANLVTLCGHATEPGRCHLWAESRASDAEPEGYVLRHPADPATVPVLTVHGWRLLDDDGGTRECSAQPCESCKGSGLHPNPTGVFYAPTEWVGCPDCNGTGEVVLPVAAG